VRVERLAALVMAALALAVAAATGVEAASATLEASAAAGPFAVGDRVTVHVSARGADDALWGELTVRVEDGGPWAVVEGPREVVGARPPAWEVVLAPLLVGEQPLPPMSATVREDGDEARPVTLTDPPSVTVASVLPPEGEAEPAPLRDPVGARRPLVEWVVLGLVAMAAMAVVRRWWRRRGSETPDRTSPELPPRDELDAALRALRSGLDSDSPEVSCDRLAHALRAYLERRDGAPAREMTSFELRVLARTRAWPDAVQRDLGSALSLADAVRFGRRPVGRASLESAVEAAESAADGLERWTAARQAAADATDEVREAAS